MEVVTYVSPFDHKSSLQLYEIFSCLLAVKSISFYGFNLAALVPLSDGNLIPW